MSNQNNTRRKFLKAAAYTAPVVMTMKAAPTFAGSGSRVCIKRKVGSTDRKVLGKDYKDYRDRDQQLKMFKEKLSQQRRKSAKIKKSGSAPQFTPAKQKLKAGKYL